MRRYTAFSRHTINSQRQLVKHEEQKHAPHVAYPSSDVMAQILALGVCKSISRANICPGEPDR
jgi:hypothetical protein